VKSADCCKAFAVILLTERMTEWQNDLQKGKQHRSHNRRLFGGGNYSVISLPDTRRPCGDFMDLLRRLISCIIITRHSLVRAKGEVFVLLLLICSFLVNDFSTTRGPIHAKFCMRAYSGFECVFSPFGGWRPPAGGKRGK